MRIWTLRMERRGDQITTYALIERSSRRGPGTTLLILLILGALMLLIAGGTRLV
jgi:hypothetical protein